jgi:hypothetical protein
VAYPIIFTKSQVERWLEDIESDRPLAPPEEGWNIANRLALAAALYYSTWTHGPESNWANPQAFKVLPREHREASEETFLKDLESAFGFYRYLTTLVAYETYDDKFEPVVTAGVYMDGDKRGVKFLSGHKF